MNRTCPYCNSSDIDEDLTRGDATCMGCGTVLEESRIVSDVQFQETGSGGHEVIGQFVSQDRAHPTNVSGIPGLPKTESREVTYYKGKKLIQEIASQLRINQHCINTAYNFFKMCVSRNFTRGRLRSHVVAACMYMTCRLENTSHLLLDFSDVTQVNVFDLGRTLNFLTRSLKINLPTTDPCLYVLRFAIMLDFGDKQKEVVSLATRIVQRMKRDWMATGRRPTGICGAALLLAAKAHNMNRTVSDIVRIVHISETVVRKRLDEFASTPSGSLTIDEFNVVDLEETEDPPAFQAAKRKTRESKRTEEEAHVDFVTKNLGTVQKEIEEALKQKMKRSAYTKLLSGDVNDATVPELQQAASIVSSEIIDTVYQVAETSETPEVLTSEQAALYGPSLRSLGIISDESSAAAPVPSTSAAAADVSVDEDDELCIDDIDDDEIDSYILSESEAQLKSEVWMLRNAEHLREMEKRRLAKLEEEEREKDNPKKKRKIAGKKPINASNHNEAMLQVIQEKKLSNKINYDILKELEIQTPVTPVVEAAVSTPVTAPSPVITNGLSTPTTPLQIQPQKPAPSPTAIRSPSPRKAPPSPQKPPASPQKPPAAEPAEPKKVAAPSRPNNSRYKRNLIRPKITS